MSDTHPLMVLVGLSIFAGTIVAAVVGAGLLVGLFLWAVMMTLDVLGVALFMGLVL